MAELGGMFPLSGGLGDHVFYRRNGKVFVRKRPNVDKERIETDPGYAGTRMSFGKMAAASPISRLVRAGFAEYAGRIRRGPLHQQICGLLYKAEGMPLSALPTILDKVEWSSRYRFPPVLRSACHLSVDRERGSFELMVDNVSKELLDLQLFSTHCRIRASMIAINPAKGYCKSVADDTGYLPCDEPDTGSFILSGKLRYKPVDCVLLVGVGVEAYQQVNRKYYPNVMGTSFALMGYE